MSAAADAAPKLTRFRVLSLLGGGGQGAVWEALDLERQTHVALKMLGTPRPEQVLRFKNEFRAARDLHASQPRARSASSSRRTASGSSRWSWCAARDFLTWVRHGAGGEGTPLSSTETDTVQMRPPERPAIADDAERRSAASGGFDEARLRRALGSSRGAVAAPPRRQGAPRHQALEHPRHRRRARRAPRLRARRRAARPSAPTPGASSAPPLYMAPEQARGEVVGAAADWYAVGVHALRGAHRAAAVRRRAAPRSSTARQLRRAAAGELAPACRPISSSCASACSRRCRAAPRAAPRCCDALGGASERAARDAEGSARTRASSAGSPSSPRSRARYARCARGRAVAVFLEGESGIGKTALVRHFVERLRAAARPAGPARAAATSRSASVQGLRRDHRPLARACHLQARGIAPPCRAARPLAKLFPVLRAVALARRRRARRRDRRCRSELRRARSRALRELLRRLARRRAARRAHRRPAVGRRRQPGALRELIAPARRAARCCSCAPRGPIRRGGPPPALSRARCDVQRVPLSPLAADDALASRAPRSSSKASTAAMPRAHRRRRARPPMFIDELVRHRARHPGASTDRPRRGAERAHRRARARRRSASSGSSPPPARRCRSAQSPTAAALPAESTPTKWPSCARASSCAAPAARRDDIIEPYHDACRRPRTGGSPRRAARAAPLPRRRAHRARRRRPRSSSSIAAPRARTSARCPMPSPPRAPRRRRSRSAAPSSCGRARSRSSRRAAHERELRIALADALQNDGRAIAAADEFLRAAELAPGDGDLQLELRRRAVEQLLMGGDVERGWRVAQPLLKTVGVRVPSGKLGTLARLGWNSVRLRRRRLDWQRRAASELPARSLQRLDVCWSLGAGLSMVDVARSAMFSTRGALDSLDVGEPLRICRALVSASFGTGAMGRREQAAALVAAAHAPLSSTDRISARFYALLAQSAYLYIVDNDFAAMLGPSPSSSGCGARRAAAPAGRPTSSSTSAARRSSSSAASSKGPSACARASARRRTPAIASPS